MAFMIWGLASNNVGYGPQFPGHFVVRHDVRKTQLLIPFLTHLLPHGNNIGLSISTNYREKDIKKDNNSSQNSVICH